MIMRVKACLKELPGVHRFLQSDTWKSIRHKITLYSTDRNNETYTQFIRLPHQYDALTGPVLDYFPENQRKGNLRITVFGCSNGAEPYSIISVIRNRRADVDFVVEAYDIDREILEKAVGGVYSKEEIFDNRWIPGAFLEDTFDVANDRYAVKDEIKKKATFRMADVLDPDLPGKVHPSDIVYAQNFLIHMDQKTASKAFHNIHGILKRKAALFIDGIDLDLRNRLTKKYGLIPLAYKVEEIHNEARRARGAGWPYHYWGLEPFSLHDGRNRNRRYSTIFLKT